MFINIDTVRKGWQISLDIVDRMEISKVSIAKIGLKSADPTFADYKEVGEKLREAFSSLGFVYLYDHGIDEEVVNRCTFYSLIREY